MSDRRDTIYLCPNCFERFSQNEVFFRRKIKKAIPDIAINRQFQKLHPEWEFVQESYAIADWRQYPLKHHVMRDEAIVGLRDYNGDLLDCRICPKCHFPLWKDDGIVNYLLSWGVEGFETVNGMQLFKYADSIKDFQTGLQEAGFDSVAVAYKSIFLSNGNAIRFPIGLSGGTGSFFNIIKRRYAAIANAAIVWLDAADLLTSLAIVESYAEAACASDFRLFRPTVYLVQTEHCDNPDPDLFREALKKSAGELLDMIDVLSGENALILPWYNGCYQESTSKAILWLGNKE